MKLGFRSCYETSVLADNGVIVKSFVNISRLNNETYATVFGQLLML